MKSKRSEAEDVKHAGDGEKDLPGEGERSIGRYEGRVRESTRRMMDEVFQNVPKGEELHYRISDALLTSLCEERGIEREEAIRLVLEDEGLIELSFSGGADDIGEEKGSVG